MTERTSKPCKHSTAFLSRTVSWVSLRILPTLRYSNYLLSFTAPTLLSLDAPTISFPFLFLQIWGNTNLYLYIKYVPDLEHYKISFPAGNPPAGLSEGLSKGCLPFCLVQIGWGNQAKIWIRNSERSWVIISGGKLKSYVIFHLWFF